LQQAPADLDARQANAHIAQSNQGGFSPEIL
jgi:hypothetical protein